MTTARKYVLRAAVLALLLAATAASGADGDAKRGQYLARAGGCMACHTEDQTNAHPYAGGRALKTPFGIYYGPNITPDAQAGIGRWTRDDFVRAMRHGERPDGANYFPAFPYPSFTQITDGDLNDLWVYLRTLKPSNRVSRPHDLKFPFGWRVLLTPWKWIFFTPGAFVNNAQAPASVNRGAYLAHALGHCDVCHTPRNFLGGPQRNRLLAGGKGLSEKRMPNLTPTRLQKLSDIDLKEFLATGATPDGDEVDAMMGEVIRNTTSRLTTDDTAALIAYLRALPSLPDEPR